jgi:hypothetical protein
MERLFSILLLFYISTFSYANDSDMKVDILASGGYSNVIIDDNYYKGYNASIKLFIPIISDLYFGLGSKFESVSNSKQSNISSAGTISENLTSVFIGIDLAYKFSLEFVDIHMNPYSYYSVYDNWQRTTTFSNSSNSITGTASIKTNIIYGIGCSALFNYDSFYFGPSLYYSRGYIEAQNYTDSFQFSSSFNSGVYEILNYNITIGMFL